MKPKSQKATQPDINSIILDSIADGVFTVDDNWLIQSFNASAETITGVTKKEAIGQRCCDVFKASICETQCALRETIKTGKPVVGKMIYIVDIDGNRIPVSISTALLKDNKGNVIGGVETFRDLTLVENLRKEIDKKYSLGDIVSRNHKIQEIFNILPEIAASSATVLIDGESGTGKELIARAIHNLGNRVDEPFIAVNLAALPDTLLESELFGYKKGAFTDAHQDKPGRFALAGKGTLFLDEIGDISQSMQVRLLRVLQEKMYEPLGATESAKTEARIIAATNRDIDKLVENGTFRQDLYYRVNIVRITLPPLRERREDIPILAGHFISRFNHLQGKDIAGISDDTMSVLMSHDYPGNVRELENIIERAFVLCHSGVIETKHLPESLISRKQKAVNKISHTATLDEIEIYIIRDALDRNDWNFKKTADELGVHKSTLYRKVERFDIKRPVK
ncbi:sigma 54-interacting transcriptional regulator [bacterium]|nr:sigma 54-interacting transcriptional regulator [bacterium]